MQRGDRGPASRTDGEEPGQPVVALVISNLEYGGAERQAVELANRLDPGEFEVHVVSLAAYTPLAAALLPDRAALHVIGKRFKYDIGCLLRLSELLRDLRADIVHAYLFDAEIMSRLAGAIARVPVVIGSERNSNYALPLRKRLLYKLTSPAMDVCIANSNAGARFNGRAIGLSPERYRVVYNGVDTNRFSPRDAGSVREELGIPATSFCIGIFGSFKPQKNHLLIFSMAPTILAARPDTVFLVVGDTLEAARRGSGPYKASVLELVEELQLTDRCRFLGNRDDIELLYGACDVAALPSLHEGTPNVALEAMASGVPVVASDVSDNREVIPDGEVGYVVPLTDPDLFASRLVDLALDPEKRARLGRRARAWVQERFTLERLAAQTAEIYRDRLQTHGRNPGR
jgi:glycosyltransferase involved in cell wall biosynthesis